MWTDYIWIQGIFTGSNEFNELPSQYDIFELMGELYFDMHFET
jgi:hypothetical protein